MLSRNSPPLLLKPNKYASTKAKSLRVLQLVSTEGAAFVLPRVEIRSNMASRLDYHDIALLEERSGKLHAIVKLDKGLINLSDTRSFPVSHC